MANYTTQEKIEAELQTTFTGTSSPTTTQLATFITEAQGRIDRRTGTTFGTATFADEILDLDENNTFTSSNIVLVNNYGRNDYSLHGQLKDTFYLPFAPIISITSLYTNDASSLSSDDWQLRTEQTGSGGDFIVNKDSGSIRFLQNFPRYGERSIKVSGVYGHSSVPEVVSELATNLVVERVLSDKAHKSQFTSVDSISLEGISISKGIGSTTNYLRQLRNRTDQLWKEVGDVIVEVA